MRSHRKRVEKAAELGRTMTRHAPAVDRAGLHVQRGEQRSRAVALVVMGAPLSLSRTHRQQRLAAVERLDLRLFINAQYQSTIRRVR
jgi:hypothetical protein